MMFSGNNFFRRILFLLVSFSISVAVFGQTGGIKGKVVSRAGRVPVSAAELHLSANDGFSAKSVSDQNGDFLIGELADGKYLLVVSAPGFLENRINVTVEGGYVRDLVLISLVPEVVRDNADVSNFADLDMDDSGYQDMPVVLSSSSDVFDNIASYSFGSVRFRTRGHDSSTQDVYFSGVRLNDALTGYTPWSLWSGLNEATREKEVVSGVNDFGYGVSGFNGSNNILGTASAMRKGWRMSALTNSSFYRLRLMGSYATGEMDNGWSFAANLSVRLGGNDWIEGVYYKSLAYYVAAEKNWFDIHRLSLSVFGSPVQRGAQNGSTQEVYDLVGSNYYNSNWGWQDGKIRNARVRNNHEPVAVLKYSYTPTHKFSLDAAIVYRTGRNGYSALDWYDTADPRPDYYRNLPSYFYNPIEEYDKRDNEYMAGWMAEAWKYNYNNTQHINWDRLYNVNRNSYDYKFSSTETRSKYVQEERRTDQNDVNLNVQTKYVFDRWFTLSGGANFRYNRTEYYKIIKDLLGGDYYLNIDSFAERDFAIDEEKQQNDLLSYWANGNKPNVLREGDKYGYDYLANVIDGKLWANLLFEYGAWKAYVSAQGGYNTFWRNGLVMKGLFPDNSYGDSDKAQFFTYRAKAGLSWMMKSHRVWANVGYFNDAPYFSESFVSPRTRNTLTPNLTTEKTFATDLNYSFSRNGYRVRLTGYYTYIMDQTDLMSFYDDSQNSFTNFSMTGIDQRHLGVELGFAIPLPVNGLSIEGAVNWGDYVYTSTPKVIQTVDNSGEIVLNGTVPYWSKTPIFAKNEDGSYVTYDFAGEKEYKIEGYKKHYVASTPQIATSLGLSYANNYLFAGIDLQYYDKMYLDMNPLYRTSLAVKGPDGIATAEEIEYMTSQEQFKHALVLDMNIGKSWYIQRKYNLGFSLTVRNILNNTNVRTGGYEQTRLIDSEDKSRYFKFDSRYFYMPGINYMLNIYFRF